jgi:rhodanese-related sulfurtransferase
MDRIVIDVREPKEYSRGHYAGAVNIPPSKLLGELPELRNVPKETQLIVYCLSGSRSNVAMHILRDMGFTHVVNGINQEHVAARFGA